MRRLVLNQEHARPLELRFVRELRIIVPRSQDPTVVTSPGISKAIAHVVRNAADLKSFRYVFALFWSRSNTLPLRLWPSWEVAAIIPSQLSMQLEACYNCYQPCRVLVPRSRQKASASLAAGIPNAARLIGLDVRCYLNVSVSSKSDLENDQHPLLYRLQDSVLKVEVISFKGRPSWDFLQLPSSLSQVAGMRSLSLLGYSFTGHAGGILSCLAASNLEDLVLDNCLQMDRLLTILMPLCAGLKHLKIRYPIWREGEFSRKSQQEKLIKFINRQKRLKKLELVSLGMFSFCLTGKSQLRTLVVRDLRHQIRTTTPYTSFGRASAFRPPSAREVRRILVANHMVESLQLDLDIRCLGKVCEGYFLV